MTASLSYWKRRRLAKEAKELVHHARHVRAMREDVADPAALAALDAARDAVEAAWKAWDRAALDAAAERLGDAAQAVEPPRPMSGLRSNLEVLVVTAAIVMAIRCFFVQPFRIPTGSMQPTLYGVKIARQTAPHWYDRPPLSFVSWALFGEGYVEVRAKTTGTVSPSTRETPAGDGYYVYVDTVPHKVRDVSLEQGHLRVKGGDFVKRGDVMWSGRVTLGDFVLVNRVAYNFRRPRRGDIIVFETRGIAAQMRGDFYIKRLVGLPGERIRIDPPHLVVDDRPIEEPFPFRRLLHDPDYHGYESNGRLMSPASSIDLAADEFLPFGDNTRSSFDGRYFGGVKIENLVGPSFAVYWPFSRRWGAAR